MTAEPAKGLVIDASVLAMWLLPEQGSWAAEALLQSAAAHSVSLSAPTHAISETANVLWKHAALLRTITPAEARESMQDLLTAPISLHPLHELIEAALELALAHRRTVYDCLYVALALRYGSQLVTADRALAATFGPTIGQVVLLSEFEART